MNKHATKKVLFICVFLCGSCLLKQREQFSEPPMRFPAPNKMYAIDSFYLAYTIYQFSASDVIGYGGFTDTVFIDTILYSNDTLKLFSINIINYVSFKSDEEGKYNYMGHAVAGYRLKTTSPWIIYPITFIAFVGYDDYNIVRYRMRAAYFNTLKDFSLYFWNNNEQDLQLIKFNYNATDVNFWDSSIIWKKDFSIPGYYTFQLDGSGKPGSEHQILITPKIYYPDSLLKLYKRKKNSNP